MVEVKPVEDMHAASSSDKHFSAEKMSDEGGLGSQILTKMSQTITESTTTHTSTKKEFISSMMSSSMATPGQEPTSVTVKSTVHSTEQSTSENGAPPVVQVIYFLQKSFAMTIKRMYYSLVTENRGVRKDCPRSAR